MLLLLPHSRVAYREECARGRGVVDTWLIESVTEGEACSFYCLVDTCLVECARGRGVLLILFILS